MIVIDYWRLLPFSGLSINYVWSFITIYAKERIVHSCACRMDTMYAIYLCTEESEKYEINNALTFL